MKIVPVPVGIVTTGCASDDVAVEPPKMQFDEQCVFPPDVVTWRHA